MSRAANGHGGRRGAGTWIDLRDARRIYRQLRRWRRGVAQIPSRGELLAAATHYQLARTNPQRPHQEHAAKAAELLAAADRAGRA